MTSIRRSKWTAPPPQTPRILHLPRRTTRRKPTHNKTTIRRETAPSKGRLDTLFDQERAFSLDTLSPPVVLLNSGRRENVRDDDAVDEVHVVRVVGDDVEEREKWKFEAEMLRAECNLLRMEREVAVKKLDTERGLLLRGLNSALRTLVEGKKKINEGENASSVLEEEIEELSKKLMELRRSSRWKSAPELHSCSNFDKQAVLLQKQLEKYHEMSLNEGYVEEVKKIAGGSLVVDCTSSGKIKSFSFNRRTSKFTDVETLRRKMERLSKGKLLKRMEEVYGSMLSSTHGSVSNSASSSKRYDLADPFSASLQKSLQEAKSGELKTCSGHCKVILKKIMEQVKAETEQWSQMQEMLGQVREEMEELQSARDFWEQRAVESDHQVQTLHSEVETWKQKAVMSEIKENELHRQVQELQQELESKRIQEDTCDFKVKTIRNSTPISLGAQLAKEKRVLTCRVKEIKTIENVEKKSGDHGEGKKVQCINDSSRLNVSSINRVPFKDIGNLSSMGRQNSRRYVHPLHNLKNS